MPAIIRPIITEKTMLAVPDHRYTFEIATNANKISVSQEIHDLYKVDVVSVNIINIHGKTKTFRRIKGKRPDRKKSDYHHKIRAKYPWIRDRKIRSRRVKCR